MRGEAQGRHRRRRRDVRTAAAVQRPLRVVLRDQLAQQHPETVGVPLPGHLRDHVALGVDDDQRRPGPCRVRLPRAQVGVVEHRVVDAVPFHGIGERLRLGLERELRRVDADHDEDVGELGLEVAQLLDHVEAVDATAGPEIEQHELAAQPCQGQLLTAGVQPAATGQLRRAHPRAPLTRLRLRLRLRLHDRRKHLTRAGIPAEASSLIAGAEFLDRGG